MGSETKGQSELVNRINKLESKTEELINIANRVENVNIRLRGCRPSEGETNQDSHSNECIISRMDNIIEQQINLAEHLSSSINELEELI